MDRAKFLAKLKASAVELVPLTLEGWDEPVYLKPRTVKDIREAILNPDTKSMEESLREDKYYIERNIAGRLYDEHGKHLFDSKDDAQMEELQQVLDNNSRSITRQITDADNALSMPTKDEIDPATKTEANPTGN